MVYVTRFLGTAAVNGAAAPSAEFVSPNRPATTTPTGPALNGAAHNFTMPRVTFQPPTSVDPP